MPDLSKSLDAMEYLVKHPWCLIVSGLFGLLAPSLTAAGEPIAVFEQTDTRLQNNSDYQVVVHAIAGIPNITVNNFKLSELSGLAWDTDEEILYALSDNGHLLHLKVQFQDKKPVSISLINITSLLDGNGKPLKYKFSDSEAIALINNKNNIKGDTEFLVGFERIPRIIRYDQSGTEQERKLLPDVLNDISNYRRENKSLESLLIIPTLGIITGPELPLKKSDDGQMEIFSLSGEQWNFPAFNSHYGSLVAMTIMQDGHVLALERAYGGVFPVMEVTLHKITITENNLDHELIYTFDSRDGIFDDNFEGITHHENNHFFMISDDNDNPFRKTRLIYFSISENNKISE